MKEIQFSTLFSAFTPPSYFPQCNLSVSQCHRVIRPTQIHVFVLPVRLSTHHSSIWKSWQCFGFINSRIMLFNRSVMVPLSFIVWRIESGRGLIRTGKGNILSIYWADLLGLSGGGDVVVLSIPFSFLLFFIVETVFGRGSVPGLQSGLHLSSMSCVLWLRRQHKSFIAKLSSIIITCDEIKLVRLDIIKLSSELPW